MQNKAGQNLTKYSRWSPYLNTLCVNRMSRVRGVERHARVTSRIRRGHAGRGGSRRFRADGVLLFGGLRELGTAFRAGGLPTSKGVRHLLMKNQSTVRSSMDLFLKLWLIKLCTWAEFRLVLILLLWCYNAIVRLTMQLISNSSRMNARHYLNDATPNAGC